MKILFASGDVGGARALLPIMIECEKRSVPFAVVAHGFIKDEMPAHWEQIPPEPLSSPAVMGRIIRQGPIGALVFSSSVTDTTALALARSAQTFGVRVIHVLDAWSDYLRRMEMDGRTALKPDAYTVMDKLAFQEAVKNGVDPSLLRITGQPALVSLENDVRRFQGLQVPGGSLHDTSCSSRRRILFVSEPVEQDQGISTRSPRFRGYTEKQVLKYFCRALQGDADGLFIHLLPHPRENREILSHRWEKHRGMLQGRLLHSGHARKEIFMAAGVVGMASILLYEAWLIGKRVISLQPDLRQAPLRMLDKREGVTFVDTSQSFDQALRTWIRQIPEETQAKFHPDLSFHASAPERVLQIILAQIPSEFQNRKTAI